MVHCETKENDHLQVDPGKEYDQGRRVSRVTPPKPGKIRTLDIAVIKGVESLDIISWRTGIHGPAPHVVFEIASDKTWRNDLHEKPEEYAQMGVEEYFAYDPHVPTIIRKNPQRLFGWHLDRETQQMQAMPMGQGGRIWSTHLDSFLIPDEKYLRLYDRFGYLRLTGFEAQTIRAEMEAQRAKSLAGKLRKLGIDPDQD